MLRIGLIGFGAIGQVLANAIQNGQAGDAVCDAILVKTARAQAQAQANKYPLTTDSEAFCKRACDIVIECAGHDAVRDYGARILQTSDLLVTSVGAFTDDQLFQSLRHCARRHGHKLRLPSAGIGALDILTAAAVARVDAVTITVRKNAQAWQGTTAETLYDLKQLSQAVTLYQGPVREGAKQYPANVNISAAVALSGIGLDKTELHIIADPQIQTHIVEVEAHGEFGRFQFLEDVYPDENNPKTGKIVAMALIKTVRQLSTELVIGG